MNSKNILADINTDLQLNGIREPVRILNWGSQYHHKHYAVVYIYIRVTHEKTIYSHGQLWHIDYEKPNPTYHKINIQHLPISTKLKQTVNHLLSSQLVVTTENRNSQKLILRGIIEDRAQMGVYEYRAAFDKEPKYGTPDFGNPQITSHVSESTQCPLLRRRCLSSVLLATDAGGNFDS